MHRQCLCVDMHESSQICILNLCLKAWHKGTELCGLWLHCFACFHLNHLFLQTTTGAVSFDAVFTKWCCFILYSASTTDRFLPPLRCTLILVTRQYKLTILSFLHEVLFQGQKLFIYRFCTFTYSCWHQAQTIWYSLLSHIKISI